MSCAFVKRIATLFAAPLLAITSTTHAQPVQVSAEGVGQVLIYPYYTTRNGWSTLLSIVNNDAANGKAIKLRFLEGKNGALVASLNVFLAVDDIWTAAVVAGNSANDPPRLVSNDKSCTWPSLRTQGTITEAGTVVTTPIFEFSNRAYVGDSDAAALQTMDRTREGYIEVIEMASIPFNPVTRSPLTQQIMTGSYAPSEPLCTAVSDADLFRYTAQIAAPTGGLSGAATVINVLGGVSAEYTPVALSGFWASDSFRPTQLTDSASVQPNLTSGGNTSVQNTYQGKTYFSKFGRSIDAVSAALMTEQLLGEHAYTADQVISTSWVITSPTKPFYTQNSATAPFAQPWNRSTGTACEDMQLTSYDRQAIYFFDDGSCGFGLCPPTPRRALCWAAGTLSFGGNDLFASKNAYGYLATQNGGANVIGAGKEGGKTQLKPSAPTAQLLSSSGNVAIVDPLTGAVSLTAGQHTFYGLPMIGIAFTQSSFKLGNPQQNFGGGYRLQSTRRIVAQ